MLFHKTFVRNLYSKIYGYYPLLYLTTFVLGMVEYPTLEVRRYLSLITHIFRLVRGTSPNSLSLSMIGISVPWSCVVRLLDKDYLPCLLLGANTVGRFPSLGRLNLLISCSLSLFNVLVNTYYKTITIKVN